CAATGRSRSRSSSRRSRTLELRRHRSDVEDLLLLVIDVELAERRVDAARGLAAGVVADHRLFAVTRLAGLDRVARRVLRLHDRIPAALVRERHRLRHLVLAEEDGERKQLAARPRRGREDVVRRAIEISPDRLREIVLRTQRLVLFRRFTSTE